MWGLWLRRLGLWRRNSTVTAFEPNHQFALQVVLSQSGIAHDAALSAGLQVLVGVDWHHYPPSRGGVAIDVVAAIDAGQRPAAFLEHAAHPLAGDDLHGASPAASRARASSWATA